MNGQTVDIAVPSSRRRPQAFGVKSEQEFLDIRIFLDEQGKGKGHPFGTIRHIRQHKRSLPVWFCSSSRLLKRNGAGKQAVNTRLTRGFSLIPQGAVSACISGISIVPKRAA